MMENPVIDKDGNKRCFNEEGKLHREDGPAIECPNGDKKWYLNGKLHRVDGPAIEWANGTKEYWVNGKLHREDIFHRLTSSSLMALQKEAHEIAKEKGWWDGGDRNVLEMLCLIHSEISEACEDYRVGKMGIVIEENGKPNGFSIEIAGAVIRIFDLCEKLGIDLTSAIKTKMKYNKTRPYRHGGKVA